MTGTALGSSLDPTIGRGGGSGADLALGGAAVSGPPKLAVRPQPIQSYSLERHTKPGIDIDTCRLPRPLLLQRKYQRSWYGVPSPAKPQLQDAARLTRRTGDRAPKRGCTPSPRRPRTTCGSSGSGLRGPTMPKPSSVCMSRSPPRCGGSSAAGGARARGNG